MKRLFALVPVYRAAEFFGACIDAILGQSVPAGWEFGVFLGVDGCEESLQAIRGHQCMQRGCVTVLYSRNNVGSYVMRNTLASALPPPVSGDALVFLDADDVVRPGLLSAMASALDENPGAAVVRYLAAGWDGADVWMMVEHNRGCPDGSMAIRREAFDALGGFLPWRHTADTEFVYRLMAAGHATLTLPFVGVDYRIHPGNASKNNLSELEWLAHRVSEWATRMQDGTPFETVYRVTTPVEVIRG